MESMAHALLDADSVLCPEGPQLIAKHVKAVTSQDGSPLTAINSAEWNGS